ncbi:ABC transporter ATP-binding protein [Mesorhizobium xinjiangense]|uniref:ABC transporter ATP-binding protein n=1 Tax=Mesorhizobium xinjiangense TaxID=2678685 RepID=UPI0012EDA856|nr:ABC transporter ATP-binding protein [Mesorhizobium xinjiangense]
MGKAAQSAIRFSNVGQVFRTQSGTLEALRGVDLTIERHEFVAVLGPSGCGKSTLLRLTAGLLTPTSGKVEVFGLSVAEPRDDIGIVFQKPTLLPWASAEDNVVFPLRHKAGRVNAGDREKARQILARMGLAGFEKRLPSELSGGMQQRVGIARALFMDPDILLMDEPFSALDALTRDEMGFELLHIWEARPKTVMFITHSISEAVLLADRVLVMSERPGRIIENLTIDLPRPRGFETTNNKVMHDYVSHLRSLLLKRAA